MPDSPTACAREQPHFSITHAPPKEPKHRRWISRGQPIRFGHGRFLPDTLPFAKGRSPLLSLLLRPNPAARILSDAFKHSRMIDELGSEVLDMAHVHDTSDEAARMPMQTDGGNPIARPRVAASDVDFRARSKLTSTAPRRGATRAKRTITLDVGDDTPDAFLPRLRCILVAHGLTRASRHVLSDVVCHTGDNR